MKTVLIAVSALAVAGAALSGCSFSGSIGTPTVAKADLQKDISDRLTKAGEKPQSVTCQDDLVGEVGKTTKCEVSLSETNTFEPIVTVTGVDGTTVNYEMTPALSKEQLEKSVTGLVSKSSGVQVDSVSCESGLEGKEGAVAHCQVTGGGTTVPRTVEVTKVEGLMMNFDVIPVLAKSDVEASLMQEIGQQLNQPPDSATCTGDLEGKTGNTVDCTVVSGSDSGDFVLTVTSVDGDKVNYSYAPKA
jgi:hypothetical protein